MKICAAQTRPTPGNIQANLKNHIELIDLATVKNANLIVFPELSLTGYEPELAKSLAINTDDSRLEVFQKISDSSQITISLGAPTIQSGSINISMLIFQPHQPIQVYSKQYLHKDEELWFAPGHNSNDFILDTKIAPAICYEISIPDHANFANKNGAEIYVASVAKSLKGVNDAHNILSEIASKYAMTVLMSNCIGPCEKGNYECTGKSSIWDKNGVLLGQLDDVSEGLLILNMENKKIVKQVLS
jgi:predicted amidohydrolase